MVGKLILGDFCESLIPHDIKCPFMTEKPGNHASSCSLLKIYIDFLFFDNFMYYSPSVLNILEKLIAED